MFFQALIDNMKGCFGCMFSLCRLKPPLPDVTQALQRSQFSPKTTNTHTRWVTVAAVFSAPIFWSSPAFIFPTLPSDISAFMLNIASWKKSLIEPTFSFFPFFYFPSPWQSQSSSWKNPVKFVPYSTDKLLTDFPLWLHKPINKPQTYIVTKIHLKSQWWKCCAVLCLHTSREREGQWTLSPLCSARRSLGLGLQGSRQTCSPSQMVSVRNRRKLFLDGGETGCGWLCTYHNYMSKQG